MLLWTEQFATGSPEIDEQHRSLIRHLNQFESLLVETNPTPAQLATIMKFLDFLEHYIACHFSFEENCMASHRCPVHQKNCQAHENFKQIFQRFKQRSQKEGFRTPMLMEMNDTINVWIQDHILRVDTELKPCLARARG